MKLKATTDLIFTLNHSLKNDDFNKCVIIKKTNIFGQFILGHLKNEQEDEIKITYKQGVSNKIKYIYHLQIMGPGLKFKHLAYIKASKWQAFRLWLNFKFFPFFKKLDSWIKIFTIIGSFISLYLFYKDINEQNQPQKIIIVK